jgi:hypothetical protein
MKKQAKKSEVSQPNQTDGNELNRAGTLQTDYPLSEKDEIKQAEEKMRKASKKKK